MCWWYDGFENLHVDARVARETTCNKTPLECLTINADGITLVWLQLVQRITHCHQPQGKAQETEPWSPAQPFHVRNEVSIPECCVFPGSHRGFCLMLSSQLFQRGLIEIESSVSHRHGGDWKPCSRVLGFFIWWSRTRRCNIPPPYRP